MRYYRTQHPIKTHPAVVSLLLLAMIFILSILPSLVFAATSEPLPRYTLTPKDVGDKVAAAIQQTGIADQVEATLKLDDPHTVYGSDKPMEVEVSALQADQRTKLWSANILFKNEGNVMSAVPMQGKFQTMVQLPALLKPFNNGDIITAEDIGMQNFPVHFMSKDVVTNANDLIGKTVKRMISSNRPVRTHEIASPLVMKKNDIIQLSYNSNGLHISTSGQAMANASAGDVIEFKNLNSNQLIRAQVKDAQNAIVQPFVQTTAMEAAHASIN